MNKHLGNVPDDVTSDRRAATANQLTGGTRGFNAIDSGNVVVASAVDLSRPYTGKHLDNIPDGSTYARPLASVLSSGRIKSAHIADQTSGKPQSNVLISGASSSGSGWKLVGTATVNVAPGTASITLSFSNPIQSGVGAHDADDVGFAIYTGSAPASPQVSGLGFPTSGTLTLNSPTTGSNLTLGLYMHMTAGSFVGVQVDLGQDTIQSFTSGSLT